VRACAFRILFLVTLPPTGGDPEGLSGGGDQEHRTRSVEASDLRHPRVVFRGLDVSLWGYLGPMATAQEYSYLTLALD
jgi:hypothetical protein